MCEISDSNRNRLHSRIVWDCPRVRADGHTRSRSASGFCDTAGSRGGNAVHHGLWGENRPRPHLHVATRCLCPSAIRHQRPALWHCHHKRIGGTLARPLAAGWYGTWMGRYADRIRDVEHRGWEFAGAATGRSETCIRLFEHQSHRLHAAGNRHRNLR